MVDIFTQPQLVTALSRRIAATITRPMTVMEVCGTHTMSIARYGLRGLLPPELSLVSGPGCPVCVTDGSLLSAALALAARPGLIMTSFGDMLRVPAGSRSLRSQKDAGADVRLVLSPLEALAIARDNPTKQVVFLAVGFETTAPLTASTLELARGDNVSNFAVLCGHKTMPAALRALLGRGCQVNGLLCPGHVAAVTGAESFAFVPRELGLGAAICGFSPTEILLALLKLVQRQEAGERALDNCYQRAVRPQGNRRALQVLAEVFAPCDALWRGLGLIPGSGLALREEYADFDASRRFASVIREAELYADDPACCCGQVLRGSMRPQQCPLFATVCTPQQPCGACMVSSEGSCAAAWRYREVEV